MPKLVVHHNEDPGISIVLEEVKPGSPATRGAGARAQGFHGTCTECGFIMHRWRRDPAFTSAMEHIARHESGL
jgi:hypothetical protein